MVASQQDFPAAHSPAASVLRDYVVDQERGINGGRGVGPGNWVLVQPVLAAALPRQEEAWDIVAQW